MFGIRYLKTGPTQYVLHYKNGRLKRSGKGLSFYYLKRSSSISVVPIGSQDTPFIFKEIAADFQEVTVQGQLVYRVSDPELVASSLDYTIRDHPDQYASEDPEKLGERLVNLVQVHTRSEIQQHEIRTAIKISDQISQNVLASLQKNKVLESLGIELLSLNISAIRPTPEMGRALEAEAREKLYLLADESIYERRNAAVEQERMIKENELETEIKVEEKKRQIREAKADANLAVEGKEQQLRETNLQGNIRLEEEREKLVKARAKNARVEADAQAYAIEASLRPLTELDPALIQALAIQSGEPKLMVSMAMKELAQNAGKIGQLNISPHLLESLLEETKRK
ncbi:Regulator of protease activity HflC, stomatin/prohibitin superfamily [Seinonella peptonophila]|uniref:Regulator of protease activity HflC, stomatin/prohibitin superfamily n=1 Tax=Seinonella peptonophila TaxID=112248 RepID=A0A1M4Z4R0_9BACL|nr:SPFH domain-containing protein [Seinonella peptonophila]SHF13000.1 Regulator of protease activity HflC, stomatin/prohibitin superfamily [Seinonella peptonophila]